MKPQEAKEKFVLLRSQGLSYEAIARELKISKSTCSKWEHDLEDEISSLKAERLQGLYDEYFMTREARIRQLGTVLQKIDLALEEADLSMMQPKELLDFKLRYTAAMKEEYISPKTSPLPERLNPDAMLSALSDLLFRVRNGEVTQEQATRESTVISNLLKAYEQTELQGKLDALEAAIGGRA